MYISIREFHNQKLLKELSNGVRPLSYVTVLKNVKKHMDDGNQAEVITVGDGATFRLAVPVNKTEVLAGWIISQYQK